MRRISFKRFGENLRKPCPYGMKARLDDNNCIDIYVGSWYCRRCDFCEKLTKNENFIYCKNEQ